ncbi:MAG: hypothetical protein ACI8P9_001328 [Parasphingorhabdus sp.]|jgi:hypothetical protein
MTKFDASWSALLSPQNSDLLFDFDPLPERNFTTPVFDLSVAWWMAALCHTSYLEPSDTEDLRDKNRNTELGRQDFLELYSFDQGAIQGMLVDCGKVYVLAFRGTDTLKDWTTNLQVQQSPWPGGGLAHKGFVQAFNDIAQELIKQRGVFRDKPWIITGHSLGAALAILSSQIIGPLGIYCFGCPRLGDTAFVDSFSNQRIYQIIHNRDLVSTIPADFGEWEFKKPGTKYLLEGKQIIANPDESELTAGTLDLSLALDRLSKIHKWKDPVQDVSDHAIINYLAALELNLAK